MTFYKGLQSIAFGAFQYDNDLEMHIYFIGSSTEWEVIEKDPYWRPDDEKYVVSCVSSD